MGNTEITKVDVPEEKYDVYIVDPKMGYKTTDPAPKFEIDGVIVTIDRRTNMCVARRDFYPYVFVDGKQIAEPNQVLWNPEDDQAGYNTHAEFVINGNTYGAIVTKTDDVMGEFSFNIFPC